MYCICIVVYLCVYVCVVCCVYVFVDICCVCVCARACVCVCTCVMYVMGVYVCTCILLPVSYVTVHVQDASLLCNMLSDLMDCTSANSSSNPQPPGTSLSASYKIAWPIV